MASNKTDIQLYENELLSANDVVLLFQTPDDGDTTTTNDSDSDPDYERWAGHYDDDGDGNTTEGQLVIDDFDISGSKDDSVSSGIGYDEPTHRVGGNKEYTFEFTLQGEDATLFDQVLNPDILLEVKLYTADHTFTLGGLDYEDFSISGSDGEVVEFSSTMSALSFDRQQA